MNLSEGKKLCGFTVKRIRNEKELNGSMVEMCHDKTGAQLVWVDNGEENKLFCIGFKTLPEDSTGVFHILEHSVLCGSDKYPVKEPFVDLLKSSMNTFLNAMTYPDKTIYPVSSRNKRDFLNLTAVYLDAVFAPKLRENPSIFHQEGIHTEINDGVPSYKGVVFNEMKGAMSSVDERIEQGLLQLLFPDSIYRHNSGGDPAVIPDLTYEHFLHSYNKFYHPSNSRIFLDGDIPLEETLELIDSYLGRFDRSDAVIEIKDQKPVTKEGERYYEIGENEDGSNKAILGIGRIMGSWKDRDKILAAQVLCDVLADTNESPLKRAVISSGLAENFQISVWDGLSQPIMFAAARNIKDSDSDKIKEIITNTAKKLIKEGIDKKSLTASINRFAYRSKQLDEPQGLERACVSYNSWLYGGDPMMYLLFDKSIENMRKMAEGDGFERLLDEMLGSYENCALLHLLPSHTFGKELCEVEAKRLEKETSAFSEEDKKANQLLNEKLSNWQKSPDSPEDSAKIPVLPLSEVGEKPEKINTSVKEENGARILFHSHPCHGIIYLSLYFPLTNLTIDELSSIGILPNLYTQLPTEKYSILELQQEIKTYIGSLNFSLNAYADIKDSKCCTPYLKVKAGILKENFQRAKELIEEILLRTKFEDTEKIKEIAVQVNEDAKQFMVRSGNALGVRAVLAHYSALDAVTEALHGFTNFKKLNDLAKSFDENYGEFKDTVQKIYSTAIIKNGITVSVTADEEPDVSDLISSLKNKEKLPAAAEYKTDLPNKTGIVIPAQISFAVKGYNLNQTDVENNGILTVASNIISYSYLWNNVRVQGGAYGAGLRISSRGQMFCYSYRDPSPARSLNIYDKVSDYIKEYCQGDESMEKSIIASIGETEPLRTPYEYGDFADSLLFAGLTDEYRENKRKEMLSANKEKLLQQCELFNKMSEEGTVCVVGSEEALKTCDGLTVFKL